MQKYELMIIISGQLPEDLARQISGKVKKTIEELGDKSILEDFWGRRKLAYKISGQDHGYYDVFVFSMLPEKVAKFENELKIIGEVVRFLIVKKEKSEGKMSKKSQRKEVTKVTEESDTKETKKSEDIIAEKVEDKEEKPKEKPKKEKISKEKPEKSDKEKPIKEEDKERLEELDKKIDEILKD